MEPLSTTVATQYFEQPINCPACDCEVVRDGAYLVCPSDDCPAQVAGAIRRWVEKIGVLHVGPALINELVDQGLISTIADLYTLNPVDVVGFEMDGRAADTIARKAITNLRAKMTLPLHVIFGSVGIPLCGRSTVRTIVEAGYDTPAKLMAVSVEALEAIPGIGPERATAFSWGVHLKAGLLHDLLDDQPGFNTLRVEQRATGHLTGKSFCPTGFRFTPEEAAEIEGAGGAIHESLSRNTTYLVVKKGLAPGEKPSGKLTKATANGTGVISRAEALLLARG